MNLAGRGETVGGLDWWIAAKPGFVDFVTGGKSRILIFFTSSI